MIIVTQDKVPVMKSMQEIERRLMSEFAIETMMGNSIDVKNLPEYISITVRTAELIFTVIL